MNCILTLEMLAQIIEDSAILDGCHTDEQRGKYNRKYREPLEIVDDEGSLLGEAPRGLVHRIGLRHSVVYCVIRNCIGDKMLLQTRDGGRLDISVGGHVQAGESSYSDALGREFLEELGFSPDNTRFREVAVYNRDAEMRIDRPLIRNRERRHLYAYILTKREQDEINVAFERRKEQDEVLGFAWFSWHEVEEAVSSGRCADGLASSMSYLKQDERSAKSDEDSQ